MSRRKSLDAEREMAAGTACPPSAAAGPGVLAAAGPGPASSEGLQAYYAARAPEYDRVYAKPERQEDLRRIEHWLASALAGRAILEVACGTGYWTQFLAPVATSLLATDAAPETLALARTRAGVGGVQFAVADAYRLPVAAGSFDAAFAGFWISHVPRARMGEFLGELHRALRPGARVVLLDNRFVAGSSTPLADQDQDGNTWQLRRLSDGSEHRILKNFPSEAQLRQALAGVARDIAVRQWQHYWAAEYVVAGR